jgi:deoxycytidine triphosphate deaminase/DNA-binding XRE family transcriptional regulator
MRNGARQATSDKPRSVDPREHLKLQMRRHGLNGTDLARELGVHPQTLYNVTSGTRQISSKLAVRLAARFGEPVEFWIGEPILAETLSLVPDAPVQVGGPGDGSTTHNFPPDVIVDTALRALTTRPGSGLMIRPFLDGNVSPASYDLTIGLVVTRGFGKLDKYGWGLIVKYERDRHLLSDEEREEARSLIDEYDEDIDYADVVTLEMGAAVGIVLREELRFGADFLARAGGITKNALRGLLIGHGLQVDPGYNGPILVTAFNIGLERIELTADQKILSLEIIRLRKSPEDPYHEDTNSKIARIVERISTEIGDLFDYEPIRSEKRYLAVLRSNPDEAIVCEGDLEEARGAVVTKVVENLARNKSVAPFFLPFTLAIGRVTIDVQDADALIRRFPTSKGDAAERAKAAFDQGHDRRTLKEVLTRLDQEPVQAIAKLLGIRVKELGAGVGSAHNLPQQAGRLPET